MTRDKIKSLPSRDLRAIAKSTNPTGRHWQQLSWANDELARRVNGADENWLPEDHCA